MLEALSLLLVLAHAAEPLDMAPDIAGPYCARVNKCCPGRLDECSVPILGTLCYCDTFCNRTFNPDCCPDYLSHCHGDDYDRYQPFETQPELTRRPPLPLTGSALVCCRADCFELTATEHPSALFSRGLLLQWPVLPG